MFLTEPFTFVKAVVFAVSIIASGLEKTNLGADDSMISRAASNWAFPIKKLEAKSEVWKAGPLCVLEGGGRRTVNARGFNFTDQP